MFAGFTQRPRLPPQLNWPAASTLPVVTAARIGLGATGGSPNAEIAPALDLVRRRSRDLVRNNEWAGNFKRKLVAHMVGTGIVRAPAA